MTVSEIGWAAGFLDAEGSFLCQGTAPRICATQVQAEPLNRLLGMFGGGITLRPARGNRQASGTWQLVGRRAASVMMTIYSLMSRKRCREIVLALEAWLGARQWGAAKNPKPWVSVNIGPPNPWTQPKISRIGWVAGFLDGDGSFDFHGAPRVQATQVDHDSGECLARLRSLFGGALRQVRRASEKSVWQPRSEWELVGRAAAGLTMTVYRLMSPDRQRRIRDSLQAWRALRVQHGSESRCPHGHPYEGGNLYTKPSRVNRICVICSHAAGARYRARKRARVLLPTTLGGLECAS